jgi:hypothetical protein
MSFVTDWPSSQYTKRLIIGRELTYSEGDTNFDTSEQRTNYNYERVERFLLLQKQGENALANGIVSPDNGGRTAFANGLSQIKGVTSTIFDAELQASELELGSELVLFIKGIGVQVLSDADVSEDVKAFPIRLYNGTPFTTSQPVTPLRLNLIDLSDAQDGSDIVWFESGGFSRINNVVETSFIAEKTNTSAITVSTITVLGGWQNGELSGSTLEVGGSATPIRNQLSNGFYWNTSGNISSMRIFLNGVLSFELDFSNKIYAICVLTGRFFYFAKNTGTTTAKAGFYYQHRNGADKVTDNDTSDVYYIPKDNNKQSLI